VHRVSETDGHVHLHCSEPDSTACILPGTGNTLSSFRVSGREILYFPDTPEVYTAHNKLAGNPLMHPWANRLEGNFFWWQGHRYELASDGIPMRDGNFLPLHGLLYKSPHWHTTRLAANEAFALHEAQLDFALHEEYLSQFPFAHTLTMRHWLERDTLTVELSIRNTGVHNMPVCGGFHPYFTYAGYDRSEVSITLPVTEHLETDKHLLPTGKKEMVKGFVPGELFPLDDHAFDDGFTGIIPGKTFQLKTPGYQVAVQFGSTFPVAVVYAPDHAEKPYVCFEPMAAPTNALQLDYQGRFRVQTLAPGAGWMGWFSMSILVE
jgi:aldose 1-epimerase